MTPHMHTVLTLAAEGSRATFYIMIVLLIAVALAGFLLIVWVKRRLMSGESPAHSDEGLMQGLRRMRDEGRISPEEYDLARKKLVSKASAGLDANAGIRKAREARASGTRTDGSRGS